MFFQEGQRIKTLYWVFLGKYFLTNIFQYCLILSLFFNRIKIFWVIEVYAVKYCVKLAGTEMESKSSQANYTFALHVLDWRPLKWTLPFSVGRCVSCAASARDSLNFSSTSLPMFANKFWMGVERGEAGLVHVVIRKPERFHHVTFPPPGPPWLPSVSVSRSGETMGKCMREYCTGQVCNGAHQFLCFCSGNEQHSSGHKAGWEMSSCGSREGEWILMEG